MAMVHLQVLQHADKLGDMEPVEFCRLVNVPMSYATEFRKMFSLARLMEAESVTLS